MTPTELRALFDDESYLHRLTSSAPPVTVTITERTIAGRIVYDYDPQEELANQIGPNMSGELVALLAGIRADFVSYGPRHPIRRAMSEFDRMCRRRHHAGPRWYDHAQGPLCSLLLKDAIEGGASTWWCSRRYRVPLVRAEELLGLGLRFVGDRYAQWQDAQLGIVHDRERCEQCREEGA